MMEGTFPAAYASAQTAMAGARAVLAGDHAAFAPVPPARATTPMPIAPRASAIQQRRDRGADRCGEPARQVAVIDFDTHHGDGTQAIFY